MSTKESTLPNRALSSILREVGYEALYDQNGIEMTKNELLARHLWEIALCKQTTLINELGELVCIKANTTEWLDVIWKMIERMDGKANQPIEPIMPGISLTRVARFKTPAEQLADSEAPSTVEYIEGNTADVGRPIDASALDKMAQSAIVAGTVKTVFEAK
jgi:hypothetical protein